MPTPWMGGAQQEQSWHTDTGRNKVGAPRTAPAVLESDDSGGSFSASGTAGTEAWTRLSEDPRTWATCSERLAGGGGLGSFRI